MNDLERQLLGYRLTTAEITYRLPDHPRLLQLYVWQEYDLPPRFPELKRFLRYWEANLDGKLFAVSVTATGLVRAPAQRVASEFTIH